jgi:hypothetical protein
MKNPFPGTLTVNVRESDGSVYLSAGKPDAAHTSFDVACTKEEADFIAAAVAAYGAQITEAQVIAWITDRVKEIKQGRPPGHYCSVEVDVTEYSTGGVTARFMLNASFLAKCHSGPTLKDALESAANESPASVAAEKRRAAQELLAEAEKLEAAAVAKS